MPNPQEQQNPAGGPGFTGKTRSDRDNPLVPQVAGRVKGDVAGEFRAVLHAHGLVVDHVIPDGQLHRCGTSGKERGQDGAYIFHPDHPASGWCRNFRTDDGGKWTAKGDAHWTPEERAALKAHIERDRAARQAEEAQRHAEARGRAKDVYAKCPPCPADHPYLLKKGVAPVDGLRLAQDGRLVVPVLDDTGEVMSLQFIMADGGKRFLTGGQVEGGHFAIVGGKGALYIAEGLATGLTIHAATGQTCLIAFDCGNLKAVAAMVRRLAPERDIILVADDDHATQVKTGKNPGVEAATEAARAVKGKLAVPRFADPSAGTDFNDLATAEGVEVVRAQLAEAQEPDPEVVDAPQVIAPGKTEGVSWALARELFPRTPFPWTCLPGPVAASLKQLARHAPPRTSPCPDRQFACLLPPSDASSTCRQRRLGMSPWCSGVAIFGRRERGKPLQCGSLPRKCLRGKSPSTKDTRPRRKNGSGPRPRTATG